MRFFNTEGPVRSDDHYCLPPLQRWDLDEVLGLIDQKKYVLFHAPRQTGKTSCLLALMEHLNRDGRYRAVYANIEVAQAAREQVALGLGAVVQAIANAAIRQLVCLRYGTLTLGMELKVWRDGAPDPLTEGLEQIDGYLAGLGLATGWLVIFDRRAGQPPIAERTTSTAAISPRGRAIQVIRG